MAVLALRDMASEPLQVGCVVLLIAGMMAPLLLLFAVKQGIMGSLIGELRADPETRRMVIVGNHGFDAALLAELAAWPEVGFIVPQSRSLARRVQMRRTDGVRYRPATLIPTGEGEPLPLTAGVPVGLGQAVVSAELARRLELAPGDRLEALARRGDPVTDAARLQLDVLGVLPRAAMPGEAVLMDAAAIEQLEAFFDGYALPEAGVERGLSPENRPARIESFRLYARDIEDVAPLEPRLERRLGAEVRADVGRIETFLGLERRLGQSLALLVGVAVTGLTAALVALFWSAVLRKRRILSTLALMGVARWELALFPVLQAAMLGLIGGLVSLAFAWAASVPVARMFSSPLAGRTVVSFEATAGLAVVGGLVLASVLASGVAAVLAARSEPAPALREAEV